MRNKSRDFRIVTGIVHYSEHFPYSILIIVYNWKCEGWFANDALEL